MSGYMGIASVGDVTIESRVPDGDWPALVGRESVSLSYLPRPHDYLLLLGGLMTAWRALTQGRVAQGAGLILLFAGCSSHSADGHTAGGPSTAPVTPSKSAEQAVVDAYTAYWPANVRAAKLPRAQGLAELSTYAEPDHVNKTLDGVADWQRKGYEPWGHVIVHVTSVQVKGNTAQLVECQDASTAGVANTKTHQLIRGTKGSPHVHISADMQQDADRRWRLKQVAILKVPCTASRS